MVEGIKTYFITGSHDETHYKNGQGTINEWVSRCRSDMIYLGQDAATIKINGVKIVMDHPGGGSSSALSYKPQKKLKYLKLVVNQKLFFLDIIIKAIILFIVMFEVLKCLLCVIKLSFNKNKVLLIM